MGFKVRKTYKSKGWIPKSEKTVDQVVESASSIEEGPASCLLYLREGYFLTSSRFRRVEATVTIEVKEISK